MKKTTTYQNTRFGIHFWCLKIVRDEVLHWFFTTKGWWTTMLVICDWCVDDYNQSVVGSKDECRDNNLDVVLAVDQGQEFLVNEKRTPLFVIDPTVTKSLIRLTTGSNGQRRRLPGLFCHSNVWSRLLLPLFCKLQLLPSCTLPYFTVATLTS